MTENGPPSPKPVSAPWPQGYDINPAVGWNVGVIVVGAIIAFIGMIAGFTARADSAIQQTVQALWMIEGLFGLLIAAVGILGATIGSVLAKPLRRVI